MKYGIILADPPWQYANAGCRGAAENIYSTMTVDDICGLPIRDMANDSTVLLLWTTWPQLREGLQVANAWGFEYKTAFPWVKVTSVSPDLWGQINISVPYGVGFWARGTTEPLLIATMPEAKPPPNGFIGLLSPNLHHSRKPESVYQYAESLPGPYLELFARRPREGWDVWGNEVKSNIDLQVTA